MPNLVLGGGGAAADAYTIDNSVRIEKGSGLSKTIAGDGNKTTWTWSGWTKNAFDWSSTADNVLFSALHTSGAGSGRFLGYFRGQDPQYFEINQYQGSYSTQMATNAVYRDPGAWLHVVVVWDTDNGVTANNARIWINGERITLFRTENLPSDGEASSINEADCTQAVGFGTWDTTDTGIDSYLAEVYFIDGQALDADSFGELDSTTNQWIPLDSDDVKAAVTFGTNGYYQKYGSTELANSFTDSDFHVIHTVAPNGDVHTDTSVKKFGTASAQMDNTGDYLSTPQGQGDFNFSGGEDFTIESWIRLDDLSGHSPIFSQGVTGSDGYTMYFIFHYVNGLAFTNYVDASTTFGCQEGSVSGWAIDTWYHVVLMHKDDYYYLFKDGVQVASLSESRNVGTKTTDAFIGYHYNTSPSSYLDGYMDEFRLSKNIARYSTSGFDVQTSEFTADEYTKLLLHMNGSDSGVIFTDSSWAGTGGTGHTITANGDVTNTRAVRKVGDSSIIFDGTGDYLTVPNSTDWDFGTDPFTWEAWVNVDSGISTSGSIISLEGTGYNAFVRVMSNGHLQLRVGTGNDSQADSGTTGTDIADDAWHHVAAVRESATSLKVFLDGVLDNSATVSSADVQTSGLLAVGAHNTGAAPFTGYMDEVRVSNVARYTGNFTTFGQDGGTIANPTPFTADANTKLLIHSNWDGGLGADSSGNYNSFTPTNLVATDQCVDVPTNNFATLNPLQLEGTLSEGNLKVVTNVAEKFGSASTIIPSSGKWYAESYLVEHITTPVFAVSISHDPANDHLTTEPPGSSTNGWTYYSPTGEILRDGALSSYGDSCTDGDILSIAVDIENLKVFWSKNGVWQNSGDPAAGTNGTTITDPSGTVVGGYAIVYGDSSGGKGATQVVNFGQDSSFAANKTSGSAAASDSKGKGDFYYTPPTDYLALCTDNLSAPEIALPGENFNTVLYTGDGATTQAITGVGFEPNFLWLKSKTANDFNILVDSVRGATNWLSTNSTIAQQPDAEYVASLDSDGFTVGVNTVTNDNTETYAAWNWLAGTTFDPTDSPATIVTALGSSNAAAGFSIVKYTGTGSTATIGHGLAETPNYISVKNLTDTYNWFMGSGLLTNNWSDWMHWNKTDGDGTNSTDTWNGQAPSPTVFTVDSTANSNGTGKEYVAYCWHSVEGYSKVGSFEGNYNVDGVFIYLGFKPAFFMWKRAAGSGGDDGGWAMMDNKRNPYNVVDTNLYANSRDPYESKNDIDFVSNGVKMRNIEMQGTSTTYVYLAFAESPFKYSNAR